MGRVASVALPQAHNVCERATLRHWPNDPVLISQAFKVLAGEGAHGNPQRVATNWTHYKGRRRLNRDRGCWQLSNLYHPEVTDAQAFDPDFAAQKAYDIYKGRGDSFSAWCSADKMLGVKSC